MPELDPKALADLIQHGGVHFRTGGTSYIFSCPRCSKKDKLYLRKRDGRFKCFSGSCTEGELGEFSGWPEYALAEIYGRPIEEIKEQLYGIGFQGILKEPGHRLTFVDHWGEFGGTVEENIPDPLPHIPWGPDIIDIESPQGRPAVTYLAGRGIDLDLAKRYGVRYCPAKSRVVFPVEVDGMLVGWQGRYIKDTSHWNEQQGRLVTVPKIMTTGQVGGKCFMFQDRLNGSSQAILVEGPVDAIKCDLCGGGNIASMGKNVTAQQIDIIKAAGITKLYIGLDRDAASDVNRIADIMMESYIECYRLLPLPGIHDIGDMTVEQTLNAYWRAARILPGHFSIDWS